MQLLCVTSIVDDVTILVMGETATFTTLMSTLVHWYPSGLWQVGFIIAPAMAFLQLKLLYIFSFVAVVVSVIDDVVVVVIVAFVAALICFKYSDLNG